MDFSFLFEIPSELKIIYFWQIYGNWIFDLVSVIFVPVWITFWTALMCRRRDEDTVQMIAKEKQQ